MNSIRLLFYVFSFVLISSFDIVKITKSNDRLKVNPENDSILNLSTIVDSIQYVILQTEKSIDRISGTIILDDRIYFIDPKTTTFYCFDKKGEFIFEINDVGKGPGEFIKPITFAIDRYQDEIIISCSAFQKILHYSLNGSFIKETSTHGYLTKIHVLDNNHYVVYSFRDKGERMMYNVVKKDFSEVVSSDIPHDYGKHSFPISRPVWTYKNRTFIMFSFDHTIYEIMEDYRIQEAYNIDFGEYTLPESVFGPYGPNTLGNIKKLEHSSSKSFCQNIISCSEYKGKLFMTYVVGELNHQGKHTIIDYNTGKQYLSKNIINDLDGIQVFSFNGISDTGLAYGLVQPYKLTDEQLKSIGGIDRNSNPVLSLIYLK